MIIFFVVILVNVISAEVTDDTKFIQSLPENVKKVFIEKVSRRILDEVPKVDSNEAVMADGEIIDAKLEEQSDFVNKILREEIDSLKARRQNTVDDKFDVFEKNSRSVNNTSQSATGNNEKSEHIDLTLRSRSKRADENSRVEKGLEKNSGDDENSKKEKRTVEVNENDNKAGKNTSKENQKFKSEHEINLGKLSNTQEEKIKNKDKPSGDVSSDDINKTIASGYKDARIKNTESSNFVTTPAIVTTTDILSDVTEKHDITVINEELKSDKQQIRSELVNDEIRKLESELSNNTFINNENSSSEFLENTPSEIPLEIYTEKSDHSVLTTTPSLIATSTSYDATTVTYEKLTTNPEVVGKSSDHKKSKALLRSKIDEKNAEANNDTIKLSITLQTKKPCNNTNTINDTKSDCEKSNPSKTGYSDVAAISNAMIINDNHKAVQVSEISSQIKKPCNNTDNSNVTKSDCEKGNKEDKSKTVLMEDTQVIRKQSSSGEHFGGLVKQRADSTKLTSVQQSKNDNVKQSLYSVHKAEIKKVKLKSNDGLSVDKSKLYLRDNSQDYKRKHSISAEHFGDLQVAKVYQVFEVDADTPSFAKVTKIYNNNDNEDFSKFKNYNLEQPQYYPVYNYDPKNAYYNAFNRLGPNIDDNTDDDDLHKSNLMDNKNIKILDSTTVVTEKRTLSFENSFEDYKRSGRGRPRGEKIESNEKDKKYEKFMSESFEGDHPFDALGKGLKSRLEATRHILHRNKIFGYVPTNEERNNEIVVALKKLFKNENDWKDVLGVSQEDDTLLRAGGDKDNVPKDTLEIDRDFVNLKESIEYTKRSNKNHKNASSKSNVLLNLNKNKITLNGETYNLIDGLLPVKQKTARKPFRFSKTTRKPLDKNGVKQFHIDFNRNEKDSKKVSLSSKGKSKKRWGKTHKRKYIKNGSGNKRNQAVEREFGVKDAKVKLKPARAGNSIVSLLGQRFKIENDPKKNLRQNVPNNDDNTNYMINTIEQVINITPEIDMPVNIEEMLENDATIMRSRDDDLELHLKILKDMVTTGNRALERYDWLGTTVDIQAALTKLFDLLHRIKSRQYIHPLDLELLRYVEEIFETSKKLSVQRETETRKLEIKDYNRNADQRNRKLPKRKKKVPNPFQVIQKMYKVRSAGYEFNERKEPNNLEDFLLSLQDGLIDFHNLIKQISLVTKYTNQRWYKNIKQLYLARATKKEYLAVLLHLFSTRLFGLLEESLKAGAEEDYEAYIKKNRAQVDRTEVEVMFIFRILIAIKNL